MHVKEETRATLEHQKGGSLDALRQWDKTPPLPGLGKFRLPNLFNFKEPVAAVNGSWLCGKNNKDANK